jgi:hypothetical protein
MSNARAMFVSVIGNGDDEELDEFRMQLFDELSLLNIESVEPVTAAEAPPGTRGIEAAALGTLLLKFGPGAIGMVVRTVRAWVQRSSANIVELCIDDDCIKVGKATTAEQERLIALFEARHGSQ